MGSRLAGKGRRPRSSRTPDLDAGGMRSGVLPAGDDGPMRLLLTSGLRRNRLAAAGGAAFDGMRIRATALSRT